MAITAIPGYKKTAYVPGGSSPKVAKAIQAAGMPRSAPAASNPFGAGAITYTPPPLYPGGTLGGPLGTGQSASEIASTTRTVSPLQVYQDEVLADPGAVAAEGIFNSTAKNLADARTYAIQQALIK